MRKTLFLVMLAALCGCSDEPKPPPKWSSTVRVSTYDGELSRYGVNAHPVEQMIAYIKDETVHTGAVVFQTDEAIVVKGEEFVAKGSLLAARHPFPHTPYYTVYAVKDASGDDWVPATGVVAWPHPPPVLTENNTWLSFISLPQPEG